MVQPHRRQRYALRFGSFTNKVTKLLSRLFKLSKLDNGRVIQDISILAGLGYEMFWNCPGCGNLRAVGQA
ncbi:hypothetical protein FOVSG1_001816 [Fusarium oxysporum f. sp. vasinfectum]